MVAELWLRILDEHRRRLRRFAANRARRPAGGGNIAHMRSQDGQTEASRHLVLWVLVAFGGTLAHAQGRPADESQRLQKQAETANEAKRYEESIRLFGLALRALASARRGASLQGRTCSKSGPSTPRESAARPPASRSTTIRPGTDRSRVATASSAKIRYRQRQPATRQAHRVLRLSLCARAIQPLLPTAALLPRGRVANGRPPSAAPVARHPRHFRRARHDAIRRTRTFEAFALSSFIAVTPRIMAKRKMTRTNSIPTLGRPAPTENIKAAIPSMA